ncbi:MAG: lytic transglycosylase domain-containing protein [Acidimicrobiia bacterium]|nr:lytic transglycosylase domain-containing protein [Acidimicrobiia bacterium]
MSIAPLHSVSSRVGEIRSQIDRIAPRSRSFAETLQAARTPTEPAAQSPIAPPVASFAAGPRVAASQWAAPPIGMLGTPVITNAVSMSQVSWTEQLPDAAAEWIPTIERAAEQAGLDPRLLAAMVWQESRFHPEAVSRSGAIGLSQLMPATADELGVDPHDPVQNLEGGARFLAWTIEEFGSIELGLAAYNAGPGAVRRADGIPEIAETQAYVPRVIEYYKQLGGVA